MKKENPLHETVGNSLNVSELQYLESFSNDFNFRPSDDKLKRKVEWDFFQKAIKLKYIKGGLTNHPNGFFWQFTKLKNESST